MTGARKGGNKKRVRVEAAYEETAGQRQELVPLDSIEMIYGKKKRADKAAKIEAIKKGECFCLKFAAKVFQHFVQI